MDSGAPSSGFLPVRRHRESDLESLSAGSGSRRSFRFTPAHNSFLGISPLGATTPQFFAPPVLPFVNNAVSMPNHEVFQQTQGYSSGNNFSQANSSNPFHQFPAMDSSFPGHGHPFHFYHSNGSLGMVGYPAFQNSGFGQFSAPTLETNPPAAFNQMSNLSPSICKAEQKIVSQDIFSVSKSVEKSPSTIPLQLADNAASPGALQKTQSKTIKSDYESFLARYLQSESSGDDEDFVPTSDVSENESDDSSSAESSELDSNIPLKQHHHLFSNSFGQRTNERFLPNTKNDISPEEVQDVLQDARFSGISKSSSSRLVKLNDKELYRLRQQLADHMQLLVQSFMICKISNDPENETVDKEIEKLLALLMEARQSISLHRPFTIPLNCIVTRATWNKFLLENPQYRNPLDCVVMDTWESVEKNLATKKFTIQDGFDRMLPYFDRKLIPECFDSKLLRARRNRKLKFTPSEDKLLMLGVESFSEQVVSSSNSSKSLVPKTWQSIQMRFLPTKTPEQIRNRYRNIYIRKDNQDPLENLKRGGRRLPLNWTLENIELLKKGYQKYGPRWSDIVKEFLPQFSRKQARREYLRLSQEGLVSGSASFSSNFADSGDKCPQEIYGAELSSESETDVDGTICSAATLKRQKLKPGLPNISSGTAFQPESTKPCSFADESTTVAAKESEIWGKEHDRLVLLNLKQFGSQVSTWPRGSALDSFSPARISARLLELCTLIASSCSLP